MMGNKIAGILIGKPEINALFELLVNKLSFSELRSLLLETYELKSKRKNYHTILSEYKSNRFTKPSDINPVVKRKLELSIFSLLPPDFKLIDLSPLAPLGTSSILTTVHQNNVVSTIRNLEVAADTTNVLAIECAIKRYELLKKSPKSVETVKLSSAQQLTRGQPFENKNFSAHFGVIALCTAGKDEGNCKFEIKSLKEHISFYLNLIEQLIDAKEIKCIHLKVFSYKGYNNTKLIETIKNEFINKQFLHIFVEDDSPFGKNYYSRLRFMINIVNQSNEEINYIDGGFTDWTAKLLENKKERLLTSGIGTDLLLRTLKIKSGDAI